MELNFELLKALSETPGAPGYENRIREYVSEEIDPLVDEIGTDHLGNLIALKKGSHTQPKKVMVAAHLDEISFMVSHIDDQGFLRFIPLGGFDPKTLTSMRVLVHGKTDLLGVMGCKPVHLMSAEERKKPLEVKDYYIDLGLPKEEVEKVVKIGDTVTRNQQLIQMGNTVTGKSLDNRVSVFILIEALRQLKSAPFDIYAVFTVQEEVGIRGANVATHSLNPDFGIALDVTVANDTPGAQAHEKVTQLGKGTAIKAYDGSTICDYRMVNFLQQIAAEKEITSQTEVLPFGGTDTAGLQRMGKSGAIAGAISTPLRYMHQTVETVHTNDILGGIQLLIAALMDISKFDWSH